MRPALQQRLDAPDFDGSIDATLAGDGERAALMRELLPAAQAYARAGFRVGAVLEGASGALYLGANLELARAPLGWTLHAEQSAVLNALMHGERGVRRLAVTAPPCGHCRQFLWELEGGAALEIVLPGGESVRLAQLLPMAFGPATMGVASALLAHAGWTLDAPRPVEPLACTALDALARSYAPYLGAPSAVALEARGVRVAAPYVENAAYNPALSPMTGALDRLRFRRLAPADIERALLVEAAGARIDQRTTCEAMLRSAGASVALDHLVLSVRPG